MKRTYRYIAVALALAVATVSFTSCGSGKAETATDIAVATTVTTEQVQTQVVTDKQGNTKIVTVPNTTAVAKQNEAKATQKKAVQQQTTQKATQKVTQQNNQPKATQKQTQKATQKQTAKATQKATQKEAQKEVPEEWTYITPNDVAWITQKANEYIASLPGCQLDTSLTPETAGWNVSSGFGFNKTREQYWQGVKEHIQYEYELLVLDAGWEKLYFYAELESDGYWTYYILYAG